MSNCTATPDFIARSINEYLKGKTDIFITTFIFICDSTGGIFYYRRRL